MRKLLRTANEPSDIGQWMQVAPKMRKEEVLRLIDQEIARRGVRAAKAVTYHQSSAGATQVAIDRIP
jgi:hypothetical protein